MVATILILAGCIGPEPTGIVSIAIEPAPSGLPDGFTHVTFRATTVRLGGPEVEASMALNATVEINGGLPIHVADVRAAEGQYRWISLIASDGQMARADGNGSVPLEGLDALVVPVSFSIAPDDPINQVMRVDVVEVGAGSYRMRLHAPSTEPAP